MVHALEQQGKSKAFPDKVVGFQRLPAAENARGAWLQRTGRTEPVS
jgi:hypothetical protein